jgi:hypothetical protein
MTTAGTNKSDVDPAPRMTDALERIAKSLAAGSEADRHRALRFFVGALGRAAGMDDGRGTGEGGELEVLSKKVRALQEEVASLRDHGAALAADLDHRTAQLQAEQKRATEFEKLAGEQRGRLAGSQREITNLEDQLRVRAEELGKAQRENDDLTLKGQRLAMQKDQTGEIERLSHELRGKSEENQALRAASEQLRADKDAEIERRNEQLRILAGKAGGESTVSFVEMWGRLATSKLVEGHLQPTQPCAERMADLLVVLVRIVDEFNEMMRPFLNNYTKKSELLRMPWNNYAKGPVIHDAIHDVLIPSGGKPVGVVNARLRFMYKAASAAVVASDATLASIAGELQSFLLGSTGTPLDPNRTVRQFLRDDGHEKFKERMLQIFTRKFELAFR